MLRILVVDDNRDTLRIYIKTILRKLRLKESENKLTVREIEVEGVDTVYLALEQLAVIEKSIEILVVDLKIPGSLGEEFGGFEVISKSRSLNPLRPIIVITGVGTIELARKALTQGVFDFIEKGDMAIEDLINAIQRAIDCLEETISRVGNPFTPMTGIEPTFFGGRTDELKFFDDKLARAKNTRFCEHFLILGNWGIGKSTLLKEYKKFCQNKGILAAIVPLEPLQTGASLFSAASSIIGGILRDLPYPVDRLKTVTNFFNSIGISVLGTSLQLKQNINQKSLSPQSFLHDTLLCLWQDLQDKTKVFIILLDDLDNFMAVPEIIITLKQTLLMETIRRLKILVGMASTTTNWLQLTSTEKHHPLNRFFLSRIELNLLTENVLKDTIVKSLMNTSVSFEPDIIGKVFEYTKGHPFEMQVLCYHLFNNQMSKKVTKDVWDKALQDAINDMDKVVFDYWFNQASSEEAKVLYIVAIADRAMFTREIQKLSDKRASSNISIYLQRLVEKKLLTKNARGLYSISDKMFSAYVRSRFI